MDDRKNQEPSFNPYSAPEELDTISELGEESSDAEIIRNKYLKHEASIKSVGAIYFLIAFILLLGSAALLFQAFNLPNEVEVEEEKAFAFLFFIGMTYFAFSFFYIWIGSGLRSLKNWARITSGIFAIPGLIAFPIGTLICGLILYLMFSKKGAYICTDEYKQVIAATPHIRYRTSILVKIAAALLLVVLGLGLVGLLLSPRQ